MFRMQAIDTLIAADLMLDPPGAALAAAPRHPHSEAAAAQQPTKPQYKHELPRRLSLLLLSLHLLGPGGLACVRGLGSAD